MRKCHAVLFLVKFQLKISGFLSCGHNKLNVSQYLTNLMHKICFTISFISCLHIFRAHVLIIRRSHSLWYHHTYRCDDTRGCVMQFWPPDDEHMCSKHVEVWNKTDHAYRCDDTRGCVMQFWPPDDEHMCSKHVEAWNKTYYETNFVHQVG